MKKALLIFIIFFLFIQSNLFAQLCGGGVSSAELTGRYKDPIPPQPPDKSAPDSEEENYNKTVPYRLWEVQVEFYFYCNYEEENLILYCNGVYESNVNNYHVDDYYDEMYGCTMYTAYFRYYDWVQGGGTYTYTCEHGSTSKTVYP